MSSRRVNWKRVLLFLVVPVVLIVVLILCFGRSCEHPGEPGSPNMPTDTLAQVEPTYFYGICVDSMFIEEGQVEPGQYLSTIFASKGISPSVKCLIQSEV